MNNKYKIRMSAPLLRAGIEIETECSERYVVPVLEKMMDLVRQFNAQPVKWNTEHCERCGQIYWWAGEEPPDKICSECFEEQGDEE
jgi:uncharacterized OB-fold protein